MFTGLSFFSQGSNAHLAGNGGHHLFRAGLVQEWVQLNYDGLAQKAGCPQEALMEVMPTVMITMMMIVIKTPKVHGSWYDPSNPIIKPRGQMRADLYQVLINIDLMLI